MRASPEHANQFTWNPSDYAAHSASQQTWARELIAKLNLRGNERILDVGCGDGKVTAELARAVPEGLVVGIDASGEMIRYARDAFPPAAGAHLSFQVMDARQIRFDESFDLVFSNAVLHWVDDHPAFLRGAGAVLRSGGCLVLSCGGKGNAREILAAVRAEMRLKRWRSFFHGFDRPYFFRSPRDYERWFPRFGFHTRIARLAEKDMVWEGNAGLEAWLRTTWLPYTQRIPERDRDQFIMSIARRYLAKHPPDAAGRVHVRMVRLEIDAVKT